MRPRGAGAGLIALLALAGALARACDTRLMLAHLRDHYPGQVMLIFREANATVGQLALTAGGISPHLDKIFSFAGAALDGGAWSYWTNAAAPPSSHFPAGRRGDADIVAV